MKLELSRPICFIDLETTGINVSTDKIVEIAIVKIANWSIQKCPFQKGHLRFMAFLMKW
jgi:DNA polymerase III epsilon subunit-like protein